MEWKRWTASMIISTVLLSGCAANTPAETINHTNNGQQTDESEEKQVPTSEDGIEKKFPSSASEGLIEGIEFGIGDLTSDVIRDWGEPETMDYWEGGLYFSYPRLVLFTDARKDNDDQLIDGTIQQMGFRSGSELFGVKVGQTFEEIAAVLGDGYTMHSPGDNSHNVFYADTWSMEYEIGDYVLVFSGKAEKGATDAAYYMRK
ncbi:DUF4309 domain-containing protein [Paenibacillus sp. GCM10012307]|uniref:DUF4309 domain-containing protein n=1 Tax=Paenibacillus roseus TaxID=2798579 RepID=A0A934MXK9_9BACL|nr:DUF4309 domain-containing protein [Paenibacillus roseus]MBJ6364287.1 DUF4309 domain-containing protein [Paenibacillus roseus]